MRRSLAVAAHPEQLCTRMPRRTDSASPPVLLAGAGERERFRAQLGSWFQKNGRDLPWRRTTDPYAILVSELMLQQTQVATVVPFFERWLARFPDFARLAAAEEKEVLGVWQGLGYYSRARNLHRAAQQVVARFGGALPADPLLIATLPGVGRYTAGAVAAFAFDLPVPAVDANIARVLARIFNLQEPIDSTGAKERLWSAAADLQPSCGGRLHTGALMELGALLCTPKKPQCHRCPVREFCACTDPELIPRKKPRQKTVALDEPCAWIFDGARILLEQQTGSRWRGMWKLPPLLDVPNTPPQLTLSYPFTHHRVALRVFSEARPRQAAANQAWMEVRELAAVALTAPHRRAIEQLLRLVPETSRRSHAKARNSPPPP